MKNEKDAKMVLSDLRKWLRRLVQIMFAEGGGFSAKNQPGSAFFSALICERVF
jgi:hypothetical protein